MEERMIQLSQNQVALVDRQDFYLLNKSKWYADNIGGKFYAKRHEQVNGKVKTIFMHRQLLNPPKGLVIDHKDGNGLNNQRSNLRICTEAQNHQNQKIRRTNKTGFKGINLVKNRWRARIRFNNRQIHLGYFNKKIEAARAYNCAAKKYFNQFAKLNEVKD